jgi:hypothetical protein
MKIGADLEDTITRGWVQFSHHHTRQRIDPDRQHNGLCMTVIYGERKKYLQCRILIWLIPEFACLQSGGRSSAPALFGPSHRFGLMQGIRCELQWVGGILSHLGSLNHLIWFANRRIHCMRRRTRVLGQRVMSRERKGKGGWVKRKSAGLQPAWCLTRACKWRRVKENASHVTCHSISCTKSGPL